MIAVLSGVVHARSWYGGAGAGVGWDGEYCEMAVAPEIGYEFNEKWALGAKVKFESFEGEFFLSGDPYIRYNLWNNERVYVDLKLHADMSLDNLDAYNLVGFTPSLRYRLSDKWELKTDLGTVGARGSGPDWEPAILLSSIAVDAAVVFRF